MSEEWWGYQGEGTDYIVVFVTTSDKNEALNIAQTLVLEKLCACVNIIEPVVSVFFWKGKIERAPEVLMILKTLSNLFPELLRRIKELHSYDVPEVIAVPIIGGNPSYLNWIKEVTENLLME